MPFNQSKIVPVILSGGSGTRLWPMSVPDRPKQFLALAGERTLFEQTLLRVGDTDQFAPPIIVANARHAELVEAQLAAVGMEAGAIILEPCARNTAPAIALAAIEAADAPVLVMPSDHVISDEVAFVRAVESALTFANEGWLVTFGIEPTGPETGYGYIRSGAAIGQGVHKVDRFIEKPDRGKAEAMLAEGQHYWNGGIFLFAAGTFVDSLSVHASDMLAAAQQAMANAKRTGQRILPDADSFAASPSNSIDYAVMEKADRVAVVPVAMGWSDLGSWDALYEIGTKDGAGNVTGGNIRLIEACGNLIRSDGLRISVTGVDDLIVIASGNEIMILPRGQSQDVKKFST